MLDRLPDEILLQIWSYLRLNNFGSTVSFDHLVRAPLLGVCRRLHDLFLPLLYKSFQLYGGAVPFQSSVPIRPHSLIRFSLLILRNSTVASSLQHLGVGFLRPRSVEADLDPALVETALSRARIPADQQAKWQDELMGGNEQAWVAILVTCAPNLRTLKLGAGKDELIFLDHVLEAVKSGQQPGVLEHLTELVMGISRLEPYHPWMQLPSLRKLELTNIIDVYQGRQFIPVPVITSHLTHLKFIAGSCVHSLSNFLQSCQGLESFKYTHNDRLMEQALLKAHSAARGNPRFGTPISREEHDTMMWVINRSIFDPSVFYQALSRSKNTLHTLWLILTLHITQPRQGETTTLNAAPKVIGSLHDFTSLKQLRIRLQNLLEFPGADVTQPPITPLLDILPPSLKYVFIEECPRASLPGLIDQIRQILAHRAAQMSHLLKLVIQQPPYEPALVPVPLPEVPPEDGTALMAAIHASKNPERDIEPSVYQELMNLKHEFLEVGVEFCLLHKETWAYQFP